MPGLGKLLNLFRNAKERNASGHDQNMPCLGEKPKECFYKILLLDDTELSYELKCSLKGQVLITKVCEHLNLLEKDYFGLRYLDETNQTHWLDAQKTLAAQLKSHISFTLYFGVKFYAADPCKLREEITRYQFFMQVKRDIFQGRLPVPYDIAAELCAFAVQSELGDYDPKRHSHGYVSEFRFVSNQTEELEERIERIHKTLSGQVPAVAEYMYLDKVKWLDMYGVDLHPVMGEGSVEYFLGLTPTGIVVYRNKSKTGNYFWPRITKVSFKAKTFNVRVRDKNNDENTYAFELATKNACKHLWKCSVEHHAFFRLNQVSDSNTGPSKIFNLGSKYRYSGRTEKQAQVDEPGRPQPQVLRTPSRRQQRRTANEFTNGQLIENGHIDYPDGVVTTVLTPKGEKRHRRHHSRQGSHSSAVNDSPRSTRSAPWEYGYSSKGGLYTSGKDSPLSTRSEKMKFPGQRRSRESGSESEGGYKRRHHHSRRSEAEDSENDRRHRRRSHHRETSGSESEHSHRRRHRHRRSGQDMLSSEAQWKEVQRKLIKNDMLGPQEGLNSSMKSNGSVHSEASENSEKRRRRRRRSRSPGKRPPEELRQHFEYNLVDPNDIGLSQEQLRDIPYTNVETKAEPFRLRHSPHAARHRYKSPRRRSHGSELSDLSNYHRGGGLVADPPPPYSPGENPNRRSMPQMQYGHEQQYRGRRSHHEELVQPPPTVQRPELHTAPIVKTKPVAVFTALAPNNLPHPYPIMPLEDITNLSKFNNEKNSKTGDLKHQRQDSGLGFDQDNCSSPSSLDPPSKLQIQEIVDRWTRDPHLKYNKSARERKRGSLEESPTSPVSPNSRPESAYSGSKDSVISTPQPTAASMPSSGHKVEPIPSYKVITRPSYVEQVSTVPGDSPVPSNFPSQRQQTSSAFTPIQNRRKVRDDEVLNCSLNTDILHQVLKSPGKNKNMSTEL